MSNPSSPADVPSETWRVNLRAHLNAGQTLSGRPDPPWPSAPIDATALVENARRSSARHGVPGDHGAPQERGSTGAGADSLPVEWLSERLDLDSGLSSDECDGVPPHARECIVAHSVLPLLGASFEVTSVTDIAPALRALLRERLPGIDWWVPEHWGGPFDKYGIVHGTLPAPPDERTGEPRAIEIFGSAQFNDAPEGPGAHWTPDGLVVTFPARVVIEVATLSNVQYLGWQIPFYM